MASFQTGDAAKVYEAAQVLAGAYRNIMLEVSKLRFKVHFNTPMCDNCDGMKAGPGVIATCFQVKACNFTSVKEGDASHRHLRVLENLQTGVKAP